jgi:hypothetical protein
MASRKPLPLTTVELQKAGSRLLRMAPKKVLDVCFCLLFSSFSAFPKLTDGVKDFREIISARVSFVSAH